MAFKLAFYFKDDLLLRCCGTKTCKKFEKSTKALTITTTISFIKSFFVVDEKGYLFREKLVDVPDEKNILIFEKLLMN